MKPSIHPQARMVIELSLNISANNKCTKIIRGKPKCKTIKDGKVKKTKAKLTIQQSFDEDEGKFQMKMKDDEIKECQEARLRMKETHEEYGQKMCLHLKRVNRKEKIMIKQ